MQGLRMILKAGCGKWSRPRPEDLRFVVLGLDLPIQECSIVGVWALAVQD